VNPHGGDVAPAVAETHSGVVFFVGDRAYKMKKPVDLGFLDFTTLDARRAVCEREVELNRRLAPDVYLGVADVIAPSGDVCEHLVVMQRMPHGRRLSVLAARGDDLTAPLGYLAHMLASFHRDAERGPGADRAAGADATAARWSANTKQLQAFTRRFVGADTVESLDVLAQRYIAGRGELFARRIADGHACDGHGDLLADDVFLLDDGPRVLDCLEFDDALRLGDALADVAFLAMDLEHLGRPDLAGRFLDAYRAHAGETWPASLAHHHIAYRAQVRAKVAAIRADQGAVESVREAQALLDLAHRHAEAARVRLVLVGGLPGTGKSTLAAALGEALGAVVLRSDEIRKRLAGMPSDHSTAAAFEEGIYEAESTAATYAELADQARQALRLGESVILDASWTRAEHRALAARVAQETFSDITELRCDTPPEVAARRMRRRRDLGGDPSDADEAIAAAMAEKADPWPDAVVIDTTVDPSTACQAALSVLGRA
jgi:aminoglycoside phosphotransferase family enzyme/predicted kinase